MTTTPNVLLIMTDQQTADSMSCAGNPHVNTPAMDWIASIGTRFEHAYVTQPLCLPCRSSLQTGRYPHEIGTINNGRDIDGDFPMLGSLMADAGYECAYIGKWHVGTTFQNAGYTEADNVGLDHEKAAAAVSFLEGKHEKPFFLTVSLMNPHNICQLARGQDLPDGPIGSPPTELEDLPPLPDNFEIPENEPSQIRVVQDESTVHYPTKDWGELEWRQYLWGYYRLVEKVDMEVGKVLDALRARDDAENTLIVFVSDHGEGVAMHHWNQKQILYEQCVKAPMIVSMPGQNRAVVSNALVSAPLDIPVTLLDFAHATKPASMPGLSIRPVLQNGADLERDYVAAETMFARGDFSLGLVGRMIRTQRFKYCVYDCGENREQLFDLDVDPGEMTNLAVKEDWQDELNHHRRLLRDWAAETSDDEFPYVDVPGAG